MYRLKLTNEDFFVGNSYYIKTKYKNILVINDIRLNRDNDYTSVNLELYTYINGDKKVIYEKNSLENIYIDNFEDYSKKLTNDIINSISKNLYITITINKNSESIKYDGTFSYFNKSFLCNWSRDNWFSSNRYWRRLHHQRISIIFIYFIIWVTWANREYSSIEGFIIYNLGKANE